MQYPSDWVSHLAAVAAVVVVASVEYEIDVYNQLAGLLSWQSVGLLSGRRWVETLARPTLRV